MLQDNEVRAAVDKLLQQYDEYKALAAEEAKVTSEVAKCKLKGAVPQELAERHEALHQALQRKGESMTFASPQVWMTYKFEAYADEAQPIRTVHDFRMHCSKPGYICTKRFNFLNARLKSLGKPQISDAGAYPDELSLAEIMQSADIKAVESSGEFGDLWRNYEFYQQDGRVAKWENYQE